MVLANWYRNDISLSPLHISGLPNAILVLRYLSEPISLYAWPAPFSIPNSADQAFFQHSTLIYKLTAFLPIILSSDICGQIGGQCESGCHAHHGTGVIGETSQRWHITFGMWQHQHIDSGPSHAGNGSISVGGHHLAKAILAFGFVIIAGLDQRHFSWKEKQWINKNIKAKYLNINSITKWKCTLAIFRCCRCPNEKRRFQFVFRLRLVATDVVELLKAFIVNFHMRQDNRRRIFP